MTMDRVNTQLSADMIRALDWVPAIVWVSDTEGHCLLVNRAWREFTGRKLEESMGDGWLAAMHPEDAAAWPELIQRAIVGKESFTGEPYYDENGELLGFIGCCMDVTNQKQALDGLRQASEKHRSVLSNLKDAVVVIEDYLRTEEPGQTHRRDDRLTPRQREILHLIARGYATREIATQLHVSVKTVESHRAQLMQRLNIHDVAGLTRFAIRTGLVPAD
jgi:DNA-binding CsgD family transcriptional regulator